MTPFLKGALWQACQFIYVKIMNQLFFLFCTSEGQRVWIDYLM